MKIKVFLALVALQILTIVYLGIELYNKRNKVLGIAKVNPIKKESVIFHKNTKLKYFYEPNPNDTEVVNDWVPYKGTYTINSDSLNERFDYSLDKPDKTYRIISLGDSFTYGLYVDTKDNYSEQLEELLNNELSCNDIDKFEVINLGVHGYDVQYSIERYKIRGEKYNPDLAIWLLKDDDMVQVNEVMLPRERYYAQKLRVTGEFEREVAKGNLYPSWSKAMKETYEELGEKKILELQEGYLQEFKSRLVIPLLIYTFPQTKTEYKEVIENFTNSSSIMNFIEVRNIHSYEEAIFPQDGHPNKLGHKMIASDLFSYLTQKRIIPCD